MEGHGQDEGNIESTVAEQEQEPVTEDDHSKLYDFVIFGASGFTGQYVVEEVVHTLDEEKGLKWAIAGRSMEKLQKVLDVASRQTGKNLEDVPILIADVSSESSLQEMCQKSKVVVNCVGPYRFYGEAVVRACIENKAHHVDISGEPGFLEKVELLYHNKAKEAGVYIVGSCGWDSIPSEMGFIFMRNQGEVESIEAYIQQNYGPDGGKLNFGTWQSAIYGFAYAHELKDIRKQLYPDKLPIKKTSAPKRGTVFFNKELNSYAVPFVGCDRSVVMRTQRYNYKTKGQEAIPFSVFTRVPGMLSIAGLMLMGIIFSIFTRFSLGRKLLEKFPGVMSLGLFSKTGPTRKQIEGGSFVNTMIGTVPEEPKKIITKISGPEPGYAATPICVMQATYTLLKEADKLPEGGGVYTPGAAFADTNLMDRLSDHNIKFEVVQTP